MKLKFPYTLCLIIIVLVCFPSTVFSQLTGTKSIPGDYATINTAVTALNGVGVGAGGVIFNIAANYTETIAATISVTATGTAANTIVFQKDPSTSGANPVITAYTGGTGTPATAVQDGIWRMVGSDYVTIDGIDLKDNAANTANPSTMEYGYALYKTSLSNGCQFVTIKNCVITLNKINNAAGTAPMVDGSTGILVINSTAAAAFTALTPTTAAGTNSNNSFYSNTIQNCNTGIALTGYAAPSPYTLADSYNDIGGTTSSTGNTIINYGGADAAVNQAAAIRSSAQYDFNVSYNTINNNTGSGTNHPNTLRGIFINTATSANTDINYNTITLSGGGTTQNVTPIENAAGSTAANNTINITNNLITNSTYPTATTGGFYGISNTASPATLFISANTISNNSSAATTTGFLYGIYNSGTATTVSVNANMFSGNSTAALTTGLFCGIYNAAVVTNLSINTNTLAGNTTTAVSGAYYAIYNSGKVNTIININANNVGTSVSPAITFNAGNSAAHNFIYNAAGASTAALSISNNNIQGINYAVAGTGANTYILNSAATLSQNINSNTFSNLNVNTANNVTFISNNAATAASGVQNVNSNSIVGTFTKATGGTVLVFTSTSTSLSGSTVNYNNNNFSNITVTGNTILSGWLNTDAGNAVKTIQNNTFSYWSAGSGTITVINVNITSANNATTGNLINNITGAGAITGILTAAGNDNIYLNTINNLATSGAASVVGIAIISGTLKNIYSNKIYELQATNASGTVNGFSISGSTTAVVTANIYNNFIGDLRTPIASGTDPVRGISITTTRANSSINVYNNTIYLNASSSGSLFGTTGVYHAGSSTATTAVLTLRNNIITNVSTPGATGYVVAYRRGSTSLSNFALASNNNLFYAGTPAANRLIFYDGSASDQIITTYKTRVASREALSVTEDLITSSKFLSISGSSPLFLHLDPAKATLVESGGVNIAIVTSDYDEQPRQGNTGYSGTGSAPDIGADEFNGIKATGLSGTYYVGTGQTFTSLTNSGGLFASLNNYGVSGNVIINVTSDLAEDGSNTLYQWAESGVGNYVVTIQSDAPAVRTISGNVLNGLIRLNGAKRLFLDGRNGTASNYLLFRNTNTAGTTGTAFTFINGASGNSIRNCNVEAYTNATNGVVLFSTSTVAGGNSNNVIDNCNINATVNSLTGILCILSAGTATAGFVNSANTISNNNIFNYRDRALDILATGSSGWIISGNSFYNGDISGGITYAASSNLYAIKISGGAGYSVLNNYIGGNASLASGTAAVYNATAGLLTYWGIWMATSGPTPASGIKGNTIANISVGAVPVITGTGSSNVFFGIETIGSGINIGGNITGEGNTIGSNSINGSILITTTTTTGTNKSNIRGISCGSTGGLVIGNQVAGIDIRNVGSTPGPSAFAGVYVNVGSAPSQVNNNIFGSTGAGAAANSIRVLSTSTALTTTLTGISIGVLVTSTVQVSGNLVQNVSYQNTTGSGSITGIANAAITTAVISIINNIVNGNTTSAASGTIFGITNNGASATVTINNNTISGNAINSSTGGFTGIYSTAGPASFTLSNNTISGNSSTATTTGYLYGINTAGASTAPVSIISNTFSGNTTAALTTGVFAGIYTSAPSSSLTINSNNFFSNATSATNGSYYSIYNAGQVTSNITINSNNIGSGSLSAITYTAVNAVNQYIINNTGGTAAAALSISNNNFQSILYSASGTGNIYLILNSAATLSRAINGNTFTNLNVNTSGNVIFISDNVALPANGNENVNNNSIIGTFNKRTSGVVTLFNSAASSAAGSTTNNNNNNFSNITVTGSTVIAGWVNTDAGLSAKTIQNNTFSNWAGGTGSVNCMNINITGSNNSITGNSLYNISSGGGVVGISTAAGNDRIYANTIYALSTIGASSVIGILVTAGTTKYIYKNKIYGMQATNAGGSVYGISVSGTVLGTVNIYNNVIGDLRNPIANTSNDVLRGISVTTTAPNSTINIYYNTIYLNASSTGAIFSTSGVYHTTSATATTAVLNLRNNSITNTSVPRGSGLTVAFRRSLAALNNYASTSNNNLFYAGTPATNKLLYYDATNSDQYFSTYKPRVSGRDSLSVTEDLTAKFLSTAGSSPVFLHLDASLSTQIESGALNIAGFSDDIDGQARAGNPGFTGSSSSPDIGADEIFGVETIPPAITYTPLSNTTSTSNRSLTGVVITDGSGVNVTAGTKPRIYYKRFSDANVSLDNSSSTNGWKYTEAINSGSPFSFMIDYSLLSGGATVTAGVIQYFIVAQDIATTDNVGINSGTFGNTPSTVELTSAAFPIAGTINSYNIPFSGSYNVGSSEIFTSLTKASGLFASINSAGLMGNTVFNITSDLIEDGANALNQWTESGAGNFTVIIQPDAATLRTISGNVIAGLIRLNGADRVTIDGSNGGSGNYLSFQNTNTTGTTGTAFLFINGATNNALRYCDADAYANATNGVILFSGSSSGGNSNNLIDNCTINSTVASYTGNVGIYSAGTPGNENSYNTISNNDIYNFRDRGIDITATGSTAWTISANNLFNGDATAAINYAASSILHGIRVLGGSAYSIINNYIGGHRAQASGGNATYSSTFGSILYEGILLTTSSGSPVSSIKGNTIASISVSSVPASAATNIFTGIETQGAGINIGGTATGDGNTVGSNISNSSILVTTSTTATANTSLITGIYCNSSDGIITLNQVGGIDINNIGPAPASSLFQGIAINSVIAPSQVSSNIIGSDGTDAVSNSIRVSSTSTALTTAVNGITIGINVASPVIINENIIQNIANLSSTSSGSFTGIYNSATSPAALITISNNVIKKISTAANANSNSAVYAGISATSASAISGNTINDITLSATGTSAQVRGINVTGAFTYTISNNILLNLSSASTKTADIESGIPSDFAIAGIIVSASAAGQSISGNTLSGFSATTVNAVNISVTGIAITSAATGAIYGNRISSFTNTATGSSVPGISGIMSAGGSFNVYNNSIKIYNTGNSNALKIYGINHATAGNWNYFHNSVNIGGSGTGSSRTAAFIRTAAGSLVLRNNVLINTRAGTGSNYSISNITVPATSNWPAATADYNDLYSSIPGTTGEWGSGAGRTFTQWKVSSAGDASSVNKSVSFLSSLYDLQPDTITNCSLNNSGISITTPVVINKDINNYSRNTVSPDLGAYEFNYIGFLIEAGNSSPVCSGSAVQLTVDAGNAYNAVFSWRSPADSIVSTSQNPAIQAVAGRYKIIVTDINGCSVTDSTMVLINARPAATMIGATSLCEGGSANLTLTVTGRGIITGTLNSGDEFTGTAPTIVVPVVPSSTFIYSITSLSDTSCYSIASDIPDQVAIVVTHTGGWLGINGSNWNDPANWCGGIPVSTTSVTIPGNSAIFPVISSGTAMANSVTIQSGASLTVNSADLQISTTINNTGTFAVSNGGITLNGTTIQAIPAATFSGNVIKNLTINNPAGVNLAGILKISGVLKVTNGMFITSGYLTLLSTATQTALIDGSGAGNVLGNVTMQRYLNPGFGYKYFSSPFQAATVNQFSNDINLGASFPVFYRYNENLLSSGWVNYTNTSGILYPGEGYAANLGSSSSAKTVDITGVVNNNIISTPVLYNHNMPYTQGFNLVGNPYPSPIDWDASGGWSRSNIDNAVYYFNAGSTNQYTGTYSTYINGVSSDGVAGNIIAAMQGFFVHVSNGTFPVSATLTFNNNARINNLVPNFHRRTSLNLPLVRISAVFEDVKTLSDPLVIYFEDAATPAFDKDKDALKLFNTDSLAPNLYALGSDAARLSIAAWPALPDITNIVPLGLQLKRAGFVNLNARDIEHIPSGVYIYLLDATTNTYYDLMLHPVFKVYLESGEYTNRFSIVFSKNELSSNVAITEALNVYSFNGKLFMNYRLSSGEKGKLVVFNTEGQLVYSQLLSGNGIHEVNTNLITGLYIVSLTTKDTILSKKIIIGR